MIENKLMVNFGDDNEDIYIDNDDLYVNRTGDSQPYERSFIHNTCELLFVEEGEVEYIVGDKKYILGKNSVFIIGATDFHVCRVLKAPYIRYGVYFMPTYLATLPMIREYLNVYTTPSPEKAELLRDLPQQAFGELCRIAHRLHRETSESADSRELRDALTWEMSIHLKRLLGIHRELSHSGDSYSTMLKVRSFIDSHFMEDCSLKRLSGEFFIQPATISRNFRDKFETTIGDYITHVRISNAVRMLEHSGESITEIANSVGYNNINTFIRAFTKIMQSSPLQYRKKHLEYLRHLKRYEIKEG